MKLNIDDVKKYVEENIGVFHKKRIDNLVENMNLKKILLWNKKNDK